MSMHRWISTALLVLALPVHAAGPLKRNFSFDEKSRDALVIVEVKPQKIVEEWQISLNQYSLESKKFTGSIYKGFPFLQHVEAEKNSPRYFAGIVKRGGTHILYALHTQAMWGACFDKGARVFTFEPGKVYYLGVIDPNEALTQHCHGTSEGDSLAVLGVRHVAVVHRARAAQGLGAGRSRVHGR